MSRKLDEELAEAIRPDPNDGEDAAPPFARPADAPPQRRKPANALLLVSLLAMAGGVAALFLFGFKDAAVYSTPVDKFVATKDGLVGRKVRLEGELVTGSLVKRDKPCEYRFRMHGEKEELGVRYAQCVVPDTFRDVPGGGVQVTVEGSLAQEGTFEATQVLAKCTSHYDPKTHTMTKDSAAPGALPVD